MANRSPPIGRPCGNSNGGGHTRLREHPLARPSWRAPAPLPAASRRSRALPRSAQSGAGASRACAAPGPWRRRTYEAGWLQRPARRPASTGCRLVYRWEAWKATGGACAAPLPPLGVRNSAPPPPPALPRPAAPRCRPRAPRRPCKRFQSRWGPGIPQPMARLTCRAGSRPSPACSLRSIPHGDCPAGRLGAPTAGRARVPTAPFPPSSGATARTADTAVLV